MKSENYIITPSKVSGFALGNNFFYVVAFVKYLNYEIFSCIALLVVYGLASRSYHVFDSKLQNSCVSENTLML